MNHGYRSAFNFKKYPRQAGGVFISMNLLLSLNKTVEGILQLIYPPLCLVCQTTIEHRIEGMDICQNCLQSLTIIPPDFATENILNRLDPCFLDNLIICFAFNDTLQVLIHQIKYGKFQRLSESLAKFACLECQKMTPAEEIDLIIPVPLHRIREKERGFNQSLGISRGFFEPIRDRIRTDLLLRLRETRTQTELNRDERIINVREAFETVKPAELYNRKIMLVDDVVTTGSTLNECARVLKNAGVVSVEALALATPVFGEKQDQFTLS